jgi:hypothetical protein
MTRFDEEWLRSVDRFGKVGSRHHVIPNFVLQKWADSNGRIWVKSKHDRIEGVRNTRDVAITDFYTFLATDGQLDSSMEEMLNVVETRAAAVLKRLNSPFATNVTLSFEEYGDLATFVAYQMARSPRRRREYELMADWYGKTMAAGALSKKVAEDELRTLEFVPHQNEHIHYISSGVDLLVQELLGRPVCLLTIDRPLFLIGDEPVIVNTNGDHVTHLPDCFMTDDEFEQKLKRASRKKRRRPREVRRIVHMYPTQPRGLHKAIEIAMPISPRTVLWFGPPTTEWDRIVVRDMVSGTEADELAARINESIAQYALDVIVGRIEDQSFRTLAIPERTPLLAVCGSSGAAKDAVMSVPERLRPRRLDRQVGLSNA